MGPAKRKSGQQPKASAAKRSKDEGANRELLAEMPHIARVTTWFLALNRKKKTKKRTKNKNHDQTTEFSANCSPRFQEVVMKAGGPDRYLSSVYPDEACQNSRCSHVEFFLAHFESCLSVLR